MITLSLYVSLLLLAAIGVYAIAVVVSWLLDVWQRGWWR